MNNDVSMGGDPWLQETPHSLGSAFSEGSFDEDDHSEFIDHSLGAKLTACLLLGALIAGMSSAVTDALGWIQSVTAQLPTRSLHALVPIGGVDVVRRWIDGLAGGTIENNQRPLLQ